MEASISPWLLIVAGPLVIFSLLGLAFRLLVALGPFIVRRLRPDEHPGRLRWTPGRRWRVDRDPTWWREPGHPRRWSQRDG